MDKQSLCLILFFIIIIITSGCSSLTQQSSSNSKTLNLSVTPDKNGTQSSAQIDLISFVNDAVVYSQRVGKDEALKEFSNPNGSFIRGDSYISAYDFNGVNLANPYHPELKGKNELLLKDSSGVRMIGQMMEKARNGSGFVAYHYINPETDSTETRLVYVKKVDDYWWLASEIYGSNASIPFNSPDAIRDVLHAKVEYAVEFAREAGKEETVSEFSNISGPFTENGSYFFAFYMNGTALARPYDKQWIGVNATNVTDPNGIPIGEAKLTNAKKGGGYFYYIFNNSANAGKPEFKISYVEPVDSNWSVGTGIYLPSVPTSFSEGKRNELISHVNEAVEYVNENGRDAAVQEFSNPNGTFSRRDMFIYAFDENGTLLADPHLPGIVGVNRLTDRDPYGEYPVQNIVSNAENGGGFTYYFFADPANNYNVSLKLGYSRLAGDSLVVGAGIFPD